jgi:hypothetical protein
MSMAALNVSFENQYVSGDSENGMIGLRLRLTLPALFLLSQESRPGGSLTIPVPCCRAAAAASIGERGAQFGCHDRLVVVAETVAVGGYDALVLIRITVEAPRDSPQGVTLAHDIDPNAGTVFFDRVRGDVDFSGDGTSEPSD